LNMSAPVLGQATMATATIPAGIPPLSLNMMIFFRVLRDPTRNSHYTGRGLAGPSGTDIAMRQNISDF